MVSPPCLAKSWPSLSCSKRTSMEVGGCQAVFMRASLAERSLVSILPYFFQRCFMISLGVTLAYPVMVFLRDTIYLSSTELMIQFFRAVLVVRNLMYSVWRCWNRRIASAVLKLSSAWEVWDGVSCVAAVVVVVPLVVVRVVVARRVAKVGIAGVFPGFGGGTNAVPLLAVVKSDSLMTSARCPRSVVNEGIDIAFSMSLSWNFLMVVYVGFSVLVEIRGRFSGLVRKSAVMLSMSLCVVMFGDERGVRVCCRLLGDCLGLWVGGWLD